MIAADAATNVAVGLGAFGALMGLATFGWNVFTWWSRRRRQIDVYAALSFGGPGDEVHLFVSVTAIKRGEQRLGIVGYGLLTQNPRRSPSQFLDANAPRAIDPFDSAGAQAEGEFLEQHGFDLSRPVTPFVRMATGELVEGLPTLLGREAIVPIVERSIGRPLDSGGSGPGARTG